MKEATKKSWRWIAGDFGRTITAWRARRKWINENKKNIPFLGHLTTVQLVDYWNAAIEYLHTLIWSTMPFWLGAGVLYIQESSGSKPIFDVFQGTFRNGELLVYTIGTLTPLTFYTLFEDPKGRFPHRLGIGTLAIIIIISCASLFALQKAAVKTKPDLIYHCSVCFAVAAIALRYIAIIYHKTRVPALKEPDFTQASTNFNHEFEQAANRMEGQAPTAQDKTSVNQTVASSDANNTIEHQFANKSSHDIDLMHAAFGKVDLPSQSQGSALPVGIDEKITQNGKANDENSALNSEIVPDSKTSSAIDNGQKVQSANDSKERTHDE